MLTFLQDEVITSSAEEKSCFYLKAKSAKMARRKNFHYFLIGQRWLQNNSKIYISNICAFTFKYKNATLQWLIIF